MLLANLNVSRETYDKLAEYLNLLRKWQQKINLVGPRTLEDPWTRHILDSAQLVEQIPPGSRHIVDLGSGAGFPGLVIGILMDVPVSLIEVDKRKAAFLRQVKQAVDASNVGIINQRIENVSITADVITARALAPLANYWNCPNRSRHWMVVDYS